MKQILVPFVVFLFGCPTPYQQDGMLGGYKEEQIDKKIFVVEYKGNGWTKPDVIQKNLYQRCAEVTLAYGYDYFVIEKQSPISNAFMSATIRLHKGIIPKNNPHAIDPKTILAEKTKAITNNTRQPKEPTKIDSTKKSEAAASINKSEAASQPAAEQPAKNKTETKATTDTKTTTEVKSTTQTPTAQEAEKQAKQTKKGKTRKKKK